MGVNQMVRNTVTGEIAYFVCHNDEYECYAVRINGSYAFWEITHTVAA